MQTLLIEYQTPLLHETIAIFSKILTISSRCVYLGPCKYLIMTRRDAPSLPGATAALGCFCTLQHSYCCGVYDIGERLLHVVAAYANC